MRILVTGAAGYIGSALVRALGTEVIATDQASMPFAHAVIGITSVGLKAVLVVMPRIK